MKKSRLKILILSLLFLLTTVLALVGGKEAGESGSRGSAFKAASLPVLCFSWQDRLINPLYGYTELSMDQTGAERPIKQNDHAMDALRYFVHTVVRMRQMLASA